MDIPIGAEDTTSSSSSCVTHALGNGIQGTTVIFPCFVCETKEGEENEGTYDNDPTRYLQRGIQDRVTSPYDGGVLVNAGKTKVDPVPRYPWNDTSFDIEVKIVGCKWNGTEDLNACEGHETEVSASTQIGIAR